jgi:hypothetical protein
MRENSVERQRVGSIKNARYLSGTRFAVTSDNGEGVPNVA